MKQLYTVLFLLLTSVLPAQETHNYYNTDREQIRNMKIRQLEVQDSSGSMIARIGYDAGGTLRTCWYKDYFYDDVHTFRATFDDTGLMKERYVSCVDGSYPPYFYYSISDTLPGKGMLIIELEPGNGGPGYCARMEVLEHDSFGCYKADSLPFPEIVKRDTGQLSATALRAMIHWHVTVPKEKSSYPISRINDLSLDGWPIVIAEDFQLDEILEKHYLFHHTDTRRFEKISFDEATGTMVFQHTYRIDQEVWEEIDPPPHFPKCNSYLFTTEQQSNSNAGGNYTHRWRKKLVKYPPTIKGRN
jgi:hypothetical protein